MRKEIQITTRQLRLLEAAAAISHPTTCGGNVARFLREAALESAEETLRGDIENSTVLEAVRAFQILKDYKDEQLTDWRSIHGQGESGMDWFNDGACLAHDHSDLLTSSPLINDDEPEAVTDDGDVVLWDDCRQVWYSDADLLGERFDNWYGDPAHAHSLTGDLDAAAEKIQTMLDLVRALEGEAAPMAPTIRRWISDLLQQIGDDQNEDNRPDDEGVWAWNDTHLLRVDGPDVSVEAREAS